LLDNTASTSTIRQWGLLNVYQTHHRGQVHDMLSQAGIATPVLDLPWVLQP
jgi:uncharacterized damage-inducible protein DinB